MAIDKNFLDENGLEIYDAKIKEYIEESGSHTIVDGEDIIYPTRKKLQFMSMLVEDNAALNTTTVTPIGTGSTLNISTSESSLFGCTVKIKNGNHTQNATFDENGAVTVQNYMGAGWVVVTSTNSQDETAYGSVYIDHYGIFSVNVVFFNATVNITTSVSEFYGKTVEISSNVLPNAAVTLNNAGSGTFVAKLPGTYYFSITGD